MTTITVDAQNVIVDVTPVPRIDITIDRGIAGPPGPPGPPSDTIGGYPVSITGAANYDALMWLTGEWVNIPQVQITDGGNF